MAASGRQFIGMLILLCGYHWFGYPEFFVRKKIGVLVLSLGEKACRLTAA